MDSPTARAKHLSTLELDQCSSPQGADGSDAEKEVRDKIAEVRNPLVSASEGQSEDEGPPVGTLDETMRASQRRPYERRWNSVVKARSALQLELLEAEILWGAAVRAPEKQLNGCIGQLFQQCTFW